MKFHLTSILGPLSRSGSTGGFEDNTRRFHKNLFMDDFQASENEASEDDSSMNEYIEDEESDSNDLGHSPKRTEYEAKLESNAKRLKVNRLFMPLTGKKWF